MKVTQKDTITVPDKAQPIDGYKLKKGDLYCFYLIEEYEHEDDNNCWSRCISEIVKIDHEGIHIKDIEVELLDVNSHYGMEITWKRKKDDFKDMLGYYIGKSEDCPEYFI